MKINNFNATNAIKVYSAQSNKGKVKATEEAGGRKYDQIELSPQAKELFELKQQVLALPDVSTDKVETLKEQIKRGQYKVSAEVIAKKILEGF